MENNEILLSVVVPVYNAEQYIEECVKSIVKQDYFPIEIILVDDGSTDQSGTLCDRLSEEHDCVKVLHVKNGGIIKARFKGVKVSKGKWLTFVDADDWIAEGAYRDIVAENGTDLVITGICRYYNDNYQIMQKPYLKKGIYDREDILKKIVPTMLWEPKLNGWALDPSLCTKMFKREIILGYLEKAIEVNSDFGEDSIVIFPMMLHAERVRISEKIYYYHRQRESGVIAPYIRDERFIFKLYKVYSYLEEQFKRTEYWNVMKEQLDFFFMNGIDIKKRCYRYPSLEFAVFFPIDQIPKGSRVVLYGAGKVGRQYWIQNLKYQFCNIVLWVDQKCGEKQSADCRIEKPEMIGTVDFDYVLIAVDEYFSAREIAMYLKECGVKKDQIVWHSVRADHRTFGI